MPNTVFTTSTQAEDSLKANKFEYTKWDAQQGKQTTATLGDKDAYLKGYARVAAFLCNKTAFEAALDAVSAQLWTVYRTFQAETRNKFSRSLNKVAAGYGFDYQSRFTANTNNTRPIGIRLIGGDPKLGYMLRNKLFWKDSMDLRHGEHSHSLQWLAAAQGLATLVPSVADLYSKTGAFRAPSKNDKPGERSMFMWGWVADCFPTDMKNLATTEFLNGETLESDTYRSPQLITDYLVKRGKPIDGHFVSAYLFYRYKNRQWLKTEDVWDASVGKMTPQLTGVYTGQANARINTDAHWVADPNSPQARQRRDAANYQHTRPPGGKPQMHPMKFHNQDGRLCYYYSE